MFLLGDPFLQSQQLQFKTIKISKLSIIFVLMILFLELLNKLRAYYSQLESLEDHSILLYR